MYIIMHYQELLKLDPSSKAFAFVAEELCSGGLWEEAVNVCRQGLIFHPQHLRGRVLLGWALKELGKIDEAEKVLTEVEQEVQENALGFKLLAEFAERAGDAGRTERFLNICHSLQPGTSESVRSVEPLTKIEPPTEVEPVIKVQPAIEVEFRERLSLDSTIASIPEHPGLESMAGAEIQSRPSPDQASDESTWTSPDQDQGRPDHIPSDVTGSGEELPPEPQVKSEKLVIADFLTSLLDRYEAKPAKIVGAQALFTDSDCDLLYRILGSFKH